MEVSGTDNLQEVERNRKSRRDPWRKWGWWALAIAVAVNFYYFQEMLAALLIFTVLFVIAAAIGAAIYFVGRVGEAGITLAEPAARRGIVAAEEFSKKTFHRQHSAPAP